MVILWPAQPVPRRLPFRVMVCDALSSNLRCNTNISSNRHHKRANPLLSLRLRNPNRSNSNNIHLNQIISISKATPLLSSRNTKPPSNITTALRHPVDTNSNMA